MRLVYLLVGTWLNSAWIGPERYCCKYLDQLFSKHTSHLQFIGTKQLYKITDPIMVCGLERDALA